MNVKVEMVERFMLKFTLFSICTLPKFIYKLVIVQGLHFKFLALQIATIISQTFNPKTHKIIKTFRKIDASILCGTFSKII